MLNVPAIKVCGQDHEHICTYTCTIALHLLLVLPGLGSPGRPRGAPPTRMELTHPKAAALYYSPYWSVALTPALGGAMEAAAPPLGPAVERIRQRGARHGHAEAAVEEGVERGARRTRRREEEEVEESALLLVTLHMQPTQGTNHLAFVTCALASSAPPQLPVSCRQHQLTAHLSRPPPPPDSAASTGSCLLAATT